MHPDEILTHAERAAIDGDDENVELLAKIAGETPQADLDPAPSYQAALPADFDARATHVANRTAELQRAFREGELEFDDFEAQRDQLLREREALTVARTKAEIAHEMQAQGAERQWRSTVDRFLTKVTDDLDYRRDAGAMRDLDALVKDLAGRRENAHRPMDWFLAEAHRRVLALHDDAAGVVATQAGGFDPDRVLELDGADFEAAIARMTPDQRERFARG